MPKAKALLIGVNFLDRAAYGGRTDGRLSCPEADAAAMEAFLTGRGFDCDHLYSQNATSQNVLEHIAKTARDLESGDFFVMYYSGHGHRVIDQNGDERDRGDETFCLHDRQLLDDELYEIWPAFEPDVRILVIADSCHSGSMTHNQVRDHLVVKGLDETTERRINRKKGAYYAELKRELAARKAAKSVEELEIKATIGLISGCMDHEQSFENTEAGQSEMTLAFFSAYEKHGDFDDYAALHQAILEEMQNKEQTPQLTWEPEARPNPPMSKEIPIRL